MSMAAGVSRSMLENWTLDARSRTLDLVADLSDEQFRVPLLGTINPFLWEIGHVAYFQEYWVLRQAGREASIINISDALYDSARVPHDTRWELPLPSRPQTIEYLEKVRDRVLSRIIRGELGEQDIYFMLLSIFHEDMHGEAFTITRQTLGYPAPALASERPAGSDDCAAEDMEFPGGTYLVGSKPNGGFIFDNEKWSHPVTMETFRIARSPVRQSDYVRFVEDDGYSRPELWSSAGWEWRVRADARQPVYWKKDPERGWMRRHFDSWVTLEPARFVSNICWYEAQAYCKWKKRRLPLEAEWEIAASSTSGLPSIGEVWEWTSDDFLPHPGFAEDPYREYSTPWFSTHKVLRGAAWPTRSRLIRPQYRNFYMPDRRDIWAGMRTCALEP